MALPPPPPPAVPPRVSRRALLAGGVIAVAGVALAAVTRLGGRGDNGALDATLTPTPPSNPGATTATPATTPSPLPTAVAAAFQPAEVGVGETALLSVHAAASRGQAVFMGQTVTLVAERGLLWAVIGVPIDAPRGPQTAVLSLFDERGRTVAAPTVAVAVVAVERPVDQLDLTEELQSILTPAAAEEEARLRRAQFANFDATPAWSQPWLVPTEGPLSTQFGQGRSVNGGPVEGMHTGTDIAADQDAPVIAPASGRVTRIDIMPVRGISLLIDHGAGVVSGYHHLSATKVHVGEHVEAGTRIASVGTTGLSTGPHLHWEVSIYGVNVDPMTWTTKVFRPQP